MIRRGSAIGGTWLSRRSIENLSRFEEETLEEAMVNLRAELRELQQESFGLKSDLAWRTEVLERLALDVHAAEELRASGRATSRHQMQMVIGGGGNGNSVPIEENGHKNVRPDPLLPSARAGSESGSSLVSARTTSPRSFSPSQSTQP